MEEALDKVDDKKEVAPEFTDIKRPKKASSKRVNPVKDVISGNVLVRGYLVKHVPYIVLLVVLAILYITNRYKNEQIAMEKQQLQEEMKNLRSESITTAAELMRISRQSEVVNLVKERGMELEESTIPPKIIENK
jgi:cell division protein FtsL